MKKLTMVLMILMVAGAVSPALGIVVFQEKFDTYGDLDNMNGVGGWVVLGTPAGTRNYADAHGAAAPAAGAVMGMTGEMYHDFASTATGAIIWYGAMEPGGWSSRVKVLNAEGDALFWAGIWGAAYMWTSGSGEQYGDSLAGGQYYLFKVTWDATGNVGFYVNNELKFTGTTTAGPATRVHLLYGINNSNAWFDEITVVDTTDSICGDPGTTYKTMDFNKDCYVNIKDFAIFADEWLSCTDPNNVECGE